MTDSAGFGAWLKERRKRAGLTQKRLADLSGIHRTYIVKIERGGVGLPGYDLRQRLHRALGTTEEDLRKAGIVEAATLHDAEHFFRAHVTNQAGDPGRTFAEAEESARVLTELFALAAGNFLASLNDDQYQRLLELIEAGRALGVGQHSGVDAHTLGEKLHR